MKSIQRKKTAAAPKTPARDPLACGMAVAERFMKINPPRNTYMYHLGLSGLLDLYEASGEKRLLDFVLAQGDVKRVRFHYRLHEVTGDKKWLAGVKEEAEKFLANPHRDCEGSRLDPRGRYTIDCVSGLFTLPIIYGHVLQDHRFFDDAFVQFEVPRGYLEDPVTGLWYNRWGHGLHQCRPNPGLWGRGNGWLVNAWGRVAHLWAPSHPKRQVMLEEWRKYARACAGFQTPTGLFRQLMIRVESFEDATASGLIGAGIGYGVLHDTLPLEMAANSYRAALGLNCLVDENGNIYNVSTTAGGYNFEQQYESCPIFNDPHGDGSVMGDCAAAHMILKKKLSFDRTPPTGRPIIVTQPLPGVISFEQPDIKPAAAIAAPVLKRVMALADLPEHDLHGSAIVGLLHWHDFKPDPALLKKAHTLYERAAKKLEPLDRWHVACELARRTREPDLLWGLAEFVDNYRAGATRDRCGLILDAHGGYTIDRLYPLLPLLGNAGALTGNRAYFDEACAQLLGYQKWLEEPNTQLWHSAYGRGAHPRRVTPGFWALGNGYVLAGILDLLDHLPRDHEQYLDVICLLRDLVEVLHEWLPVFGGWTQILTDYDSFPCVAANGLLTYGSAKPVWRGWVKSAYYAAAIGGVFHLGSLIKPDGTYGLCSLPTGGLDTVEAYSRHGVANDPAALGFILSGCAYGGLCQDAAPTKKYSEEDGRLGAR